MALALRTLAVPRGGRITFDGFVRWISVAAAPTVVVSATNRAEATMKRFWKTVEVVPSRQDADALAVNLDKRPLKTPSGKLLEIPSSRPLLASLIAHEWDTQETAIRPHALPMTSLASRATDGLNDDRIQAEVREALLRYFDTDTICFHEERPASLVKLQAEHWKPLIDWVSETFEVEIRVFDSLLATEQPSVTRLVFEKWIEQYDPWKLAALERAVYSTKSFLIALALVEGRLSAEEAAVASNVEVLSQIERWGEVEDSHDVDHHDVRRQLGSVACVLSEL